MVAVLARTAAAHGAALATNVRMDGLIVADGRVTGVRARDLLEAGGAWPLRARHVVLATGAWTGGGAGAGPLRVRPSKGVHILVPQGPDRDGHRAADADREERAVRDPVGPHWLIGDTDTEWPYDPAHPTASRADLEYLLAKVNAVLRDPLVPRRHRGRVRRPAAAGRRGGRRHHPAEPGAHGLVAPARAVGDRGREVHHVPGDGPGPDRRGGGRPRRPDVRRRRPGRDRAVAHPPDPLLGAAGYARARLGGPAGGAQRPGRRRRSSGCSTGTDRAPTTCWT